MRIFKYSLWILLLLSQIHVSGQDSIFYAKLHSIDSLFFNNQYDTVEQKIEALYQVIHSHKNDKGLRKKKLELDYLKNNLLLQQTNYKKSLQNFLLLTDISIAENLHDITFKSYLAIALIYEIAEDFEACENYMQYAFDTYKKHKLDNIFSTYCIRISSFYRFKGKLDSAIHYAKLGKTYAEAYNNNKDLSDSYLLLGVLTSKTEPQEAIVNFKMAASLFQDMGNFHDQAVMYNNISKIFLRIKEVDSALRYSNYSLDVIDNKSNYFSGIYRLRSAIYDTLNMLDSAFYYYKLYHKAEIEEMATYEARDIKVITEQYENDKKEATIKAKNIWLNFSILVLAIISTASILLLRKNKKIKKQNILINKHAKTVEQYLEQKNILLAELQHRVKNNLQQVISLLEIQRESLDYNNIDEIIRENQNRIQSMALMHNKLSISTTHHSIEIDSYLKELATLVEKSYSIDTYNMNVTINTLVKYVSIDTAMSLGLIVVELISNSIKHAFQKNDSGKIEILFTENIDTNQYQLTYSDNGKGFNFENIVTKGLGIEIIKGLILQLNGWSEVGKHNGFQLSIYFTNDLNKKNYNSHL